MAAHRPNRLVPSEDREGRAGLEHLTERRVGVLAEAVQVGRHEFCVDLDELVLKRQGSLRSETVGNLRRCTECCGCDGKWVIIRQI